MTEVTVARELRADGNVVLTLAGEVDLANAGELAVDVRREVTATAFALALDLREVSYLDSAGIRLLFDLADRLHARRQELVVVVAPGSLLENVLRMVAMDRVAVVATDLEAGLAQAMPDAGADGAEPGR